MKILKYIAILAATMLACGSYAADASSNEPVQVVVNNENGLLSVSVKLNVTDPTASCDEVIKEALKKALASVGADSLNGKAISAAMIAIKSAVKDANAPALGIVSVSFQIKNKVEGAENIAQVRTEVLIAGESYLSNTETRFNPETQVASTTGNVDVRGQSGTVSAAPVILAVAADGSVTGNVGGVSVADSVVDKSAQAALTTPTSVQESAAQGTNSVPDNTIVSSGQN